MDYINKFNETFEDLIDDLIQVFPNDSEFRFYKVALKTGLMADKTIVSKFFHEKAQHMSDKILNKDEQFFLDKDYEELNEKDGGAIVNKLKRCWTSLSDDNKETVWKYLKVLVLLNKKIYE